MPDIPIMGPVRRFMFLDLSERGSAYNRYEPSDLRHLEPVAVWERLMGRPVQARFNPKDAMQEIDQAAAME